MKELSPSHRVTGENSARVCECQALPPSRSLPGTTRTCVSSSTGRCRDRSTTERNVAARIRTSIPYVQGTDRHRLDYRLTWTAEISAVNCLSVRLVPTAQPRPESPGCASHHGGVLRENPGIPHRSMEVADPAGPITAERPDDRAGGVCLPRWVSPRGHATRSRRRRDLNPDHGRDRTVCSPDYTTSACRPGRNRTGDFRIQSPASLTGRRTSSEPCLASVGRTPAETPGLNVAAANAAGMRISDS